MKLFLITGAGQGLGRQLARDFDQEEVHLLLFGRTFEKLAKTKSELSRAMVDLINVDLVQYQEVLEKLDKFDFSIYEEVVLINNAATWTGGVSIKEITPQFMREAFDLNFMSAFNITKATLELSSPNTKIKILNIGATASKRGGANMAAFAIPKASLRVFTECLARELGREKVHACHVIVDGLLNNERTRSISSNLMDHEFIQQESLSSTIRHLIDQNESCWTLELDVRPYCEKF